MSSPTIHEHGLRPSQPPAAPRGGGLDRTVLAAGADQRRTHLRRIEDAIDQACEAAALDHAPRGLTRDRATWDRRAWGRYLAEAVSQAGRHGSEIVRLRREAAQLDRLAGGVP